MAPDLTSYIPRLIAEWERAAPEAAVRLIDGTLVLVDVSGFTAMSERLARKGKVGAEEVTEVMNTSFTRLLASAYDEGGYLLKFGGDALLLFFSGDAHALRGCRAAFRMRQELRQVGRFHTSAGFVSLRMSVGVHSGEVAFFLAGGSHRELIVAGPAVTKTVEMENAAQAGEILISPATAAALSPSAFGDEVRGGHLLRRMPDASTITHPDSHAGETPAHPEEYISVAVREHLESAGAESEHRQVTVAFLHFDGTDALIERDGAASVASALDALVRTVQDACAEHSICFLATDIDRDGGKIILAAGAPKSAGNDDERMLRALRAIVDHPGALCLRIGVNRGHVFTGDVGPAFRRTYTVMGDAVNLAARLMAKAQPSQILATSDVLDRSPTDFHLTPLESFMVKGKAAPVSAWAVGAIRGTRERRQTSGERLVGREQEMEILLASLHALHDRGTSVVEIVGDSGIGKSRLIEELLARAGGIACFQSAAQQYESSTPYFAFRGVLRPLLGIESGGAEGGEQLVHRIEEIAPELTPWVPLVAAVADVTVPTTRETEQLQPAFRRARLQQAIGDLLASALPGQALFVFEDVHWLDEASADLLRNLITNVSDRPWLFCVTRRPGEGVSYAAAAPSGVTMQLEPLSPEAAGSLTTAIAGGSALARHEIDALVERAGGNPLFLRELVASRAGRHESAALPDNIEALLTARIDRLPRAERQLLRYASVLGPSFQVDTLLGSVSDLLPTGVGDDGWAALNEFLVTEAQGGYRFRHAVAQEVAYESLPFRRRRELHERVGTYVERTAGEQVDAQAELLSLHFFRAQSYDKAYRYSLAAGERSKAKFANIDAATFFGRAIHAARESGSVESRAIGNVYEALGDVCELAGLYDDAAKAYAGARVSIRKDGMTPVRLFHKEGIVRERLGRYSQALRWYGRGMHDGAAPASERLKLGIGYAGVRFRQGRYSECVRWCRKVLSDPGSEEDRASRAHAYYLLGHACTFIGDPDGARCRNLALPIYEELGDLVGQANVLNNLGVAAYFEGRWDDALDYYRRSRDARERAGDVVGAATAANNIGEILSDQGQLEEAIALFEDALRVWRAARYAVGVALATSNLGRVATRAGRLAESESLLNEAITGFREIGAGSFVIETEARLAERHLFAGDHAAALAVIAVATAQAESDANVTLKATINRVRGYALMQARRFDEAQAAFDESLRLGRSVGADYEVALTLQTCASLAQATGRSPSAYLDESVPIFSRLGVVSMALLDRPRS